MCAPGVRPAVSRPRGSPRTMKAFVYVKDAVENHCAFHFLTLWPAVAVARISFIMAGGCGRKKSDIWKHFSEKFRERKADGTETGRKTLVVTCKHCKGVVTGNVERLKTHKKACEKWPGTASSIGQLRGETHALNPDERDNLRSYAGREGLERKRHRDGSVVVTSTSRNHSGASSSLMMDRFVDRCSKKDQERFNMFLRELFIGRGHRSASILTCIGETCSTPSGHHGGNLRPKLYLEFS